MTSQVASSVQRKLAFHKPAKGGFGLIHLPRTREDKLRHVQILQTVPLEMVDAFEERTRLKSGIVGKRSDPISHILLKYQSSCEEELVRTMCRACATGQFDVSIWREFENQIFELISYLDASDCGIILKCLSYRDCANEALVGVLLDRITTSKQMGPFTVLYALESLSRVSTRKPVGVLMKRLYARDPLGDVGLIVSLVRALAKLDSPEYSDGLFLWLSGRLKDLSSSGLCGLLTTRICPASIMAESVPFVLEYLQGYSVEQLCGLAHTFSNLDAIPLESARSMLVAIGTELSKCSTCTGRILAVSINAFAKVGIKHCDLIDDYWLPNLRTTDLTSVEFSMVVLGLSKLGIGCDFVWDKLPVDPKMNMHSVAKILSVIPVDRVSQRGRLISFLCDQTISDPNDTLSILQILMCNNFTLWDDCAHLFTQIDLANVPPNRLGNLLILHAKNRLAEPLFRPIDLPIFETLNLSQQAKVLHAFALRHTNVCHVHVDSSNIVKSLQKRATEIPQLTQRSVSRLRSAMHILTIIDSDLDQLLQARLHQKK